MFQSGFSPRRKLANAPNLSGNSGHQCATKASGQARHTKSEQSLIIHSTSSTNEMTDMRLGEFILAEVRSLDPMVI